jgi:hypothetical protein
LKIAARFVALAVLVPVKALNLRLLPCSSPSAQPLWRYRLDVNTN